MELALSISEYLVVSIANKVYVTEDSEASNCRKLPEFEFEFEI